MSKVTQPGKNTAKGHTGLLISPSGPGGVLDRRLGCGLGGRRSTFWPTDADFPSGHKQGVPVKLGMAESMDLGAGFLGF